VLSNLDSKSKGGNEFIDVDAALGAQLPETTSSYTEHDLALYALGVGAGRNPTDARDLHLVYEHHGEGFWALPTYGVIPALNSFFKLMADGNGAPGMNYGLDRVLHGEQDLELLRPLPPSAQLTHRARVADIFDKGKNAIVVTHVDTYDTKSGELLAKNDISIVVRGAGGWGGERGPSSDVNVPPDRAPDAVVTEKTHESQALLYRLSGDWNPLHVDPEFATMFGFDRPILHGLCTYGFVARAVINSFAKGDPRTFKRFKVRFAESVFPGETIKTEMWKESDRRVIVRATIVERNKVCLSNAALEFYPEIPTAKAKPAAKVEAAKAAPAKEATLDTAAIFTAIGAYVGQHPELVKQVGVTYQFLIKSPDSAWVLDLKNGAGAVRAGTLDKPECTLTLSDSDWLDMTAGRADAMKLFQGGKLKISGNVMASQKLDFLKKLDRSALSAPASSTSAAAPASAPALAAKVEFAAPKLLAALKERLAKQPGLAAEVNAVISFNVKDAGVTFTANLRGTPSVTDGLDAGATTRLTLSDEAFTSLSSGAPSVRELFQHGQLRVDGALDVVHRLGFLKQLV
jgi:3-hydroxyacyl-CoA dehydrogenase/3a,7a,12a-trihydroxy-5b-cholest-24-enoyl-CoA hydratase